MDLPHSSSTDEPRRRSKRRWVIPLLVFLLILGASVHWRTGRLSRELEQIRKSLHQQGFKLDLSQFDLAASPEQAARTATLTNAGSVCRAANAEFLRRNSTFMPTLGSNAALVLWQQPKRNDTWGAGEDWAKLREEVQSLSPVLESACAAALFGPIKFSPVVRTSGDILLPHLSELRTLGNALASYIMLDLHDTNRARAWTNLLGLTRLSTAWEPEPCEVSHLVRFRMARIAQNTAWQLLQARDWTDAQLSMLQREWESLEYFNSLPETAALSRASMIRLCQYQRQQPLMFSFKEFFKACFESPRSAWANTKAIYQQMVYRKSGLCEDEKALMLYFRDRELELREIIKAPIWSAMAQLPGGGEPPPFKSVIYSRMATIMNLKRIGLNMHMPGGSFAGRAADAEIRRRLIIAALAVERFRVRSGQYPDSLQHLVPEILPRVPVDFIDGQPLRYFRTDDGHFILYSIGFDGIDSHGIHSNPAIDDEPELVSRPPRLRRSPQRGSLAPLAASPEYDIIWPRPATPSEIERLKISIPPDE